MVARSCSTKTLSWTFHNIYREIPMLQSVSKRAVVQRCSVKMLFLKILRNSQENTCARVSFLVELQASGLQLYLKRDSGTGVSCEFYEISNNTFSYRTPPVAASVSNTFKCVQAVRLATLLRKRHWHRCFRTRHS